MPINYYYHFQDEKPQQISGEVLFKHYLKDNLTITSIDATPNRCSIHLSTQEYKMLVVEPGSPTTVTFRHMQSRMRFRP